MFLKKDGIDYNTQVEFEYGYDNSTNRLTIPIRSEIGDLIGVKGRLFKEELDENDLKYIYIEPCNKSKVLYNIHRSHNHIKEKGFLYVGESEKFCAQLWSMGIRNSVAIGGHRFSKKQVELISRLCVDIIVCFDKDITQQEIEKECSKFINGIRVEYLLDVDGLLGEKESPSDKRVNFEKLVSNYKFIYK
jgi:DNA primase